MSKQFAKGVQFIVQKELDRQLDIATTFTLAGAVLAMERAHCKVNYDKWFKAFCEIYPELLKSPVEYIKKAEEIADAEFEIHWTE